MPRSTVQRNFEPESSNVRAAINTY